MTKKEAIQLFGNGAALGRAIGLSRGRISQLPDGPLPQQYIDRITGAAIRLGVGIKQPSEPT